MKYIAKGFISTDSRYGGDGWTASELVFNACVWKGGYRTFQPSRGLQNTLGWTPGKDDAIYWSSNMAKYEDVGGEKHEVLIWEKSLCGWIPGREIKTDLPGPDLPGAVLQDLQAELTRSWLYLERLYVFSGRILPGPGFTWSGSPGSPG